MKCAVDFLSFLWSSDFKFHFHPGDKSLDDEWTAELRCSFLVQEPSSRDEFFVVRYS